MTDEPEKVDLASPDLAAQQRAALAELIPGVLLDGVLDATKLGELLGVDVTAPTDGRERYGLVWAGKADAIRSLQTPSRGTLVPDLDRSLDWDTAQNVFIEGDNLEVLKLLQKAYNDRVKLIYIDPPYNTLTDRVYADDYSQPLRAYLRSTGQLDDEGNRVSTDSDASGGGRHSRWLSMIAPRLRLAWNLLTPDGVMCISIDDNEVGPLITLLKDEFGEENYSTTFIWQKKKKPSFLHRNVGSLTEYVLCVTRNAGLSSPFSIDVTTAGKKYPFNNAGNGLATLTFPAGSVRFGMQHARYEPSDMSEGNIVTRLLDVVEVRDSVNAEPFRLEGEWRYNQKRLDEIVAAGDGITISKPPFRPNHVKVGGEIKKMHNLLTQATYAVGTNEDGSAELESLLGGDYFDNPKPTSLIRTICKAMTYEDDEAIVLDFFAGSGTTAQAVMELNAADGGSRRSVLVQLPELTPSGSAAKSAGYERLTDITYARIRKAMQKTPGSGEMGLRVLKLAPSNFVVPSASVSETIQLVSSTILAEAPDFYAIASEVLLKEGVTLEAPWGRHSVAMAEVVVAGNVAVVLSLDITKEVVEAALELTPERGVIVFLEDGFAGRDAVKANAVTDANKLGIKLKTV